LIGTKIFIFSSVCVIDDFKNCIIVMFFINYLKIYIGDIIRYKLSTYIREVRYGKRDNGI